MDSDSDVVSIELDVAKERLLKMKAQLKRDVQIKEKQVAEDGDDLVPERGGIGNQMADDANETAEQETMLALQQNAQREIDQINMALARIKAGTYGICANCGKP